MLVPEGGNPVRKGTTTKRYGLNKKARHLVTNDVQDYPVVIAPATGLLWPFHKKRT